jgi:hypothetical protein
MNQMNPVHTFSTYFPKIHSNIIFPLLDRKIKFQFPLWILSWQWGRHGMTHVLLVLMGTLLCARQRQCQSRWVRDWPINKGCTWDRIALGLCICVSEKVRCTSAVCQARGLILITLSRDFVEVQWRSLFRSTSLGMQCTSYNAPPSSRKRAANRLPQASEG